MGIIVVLPVHAQYLEAKTNHVSLDVNGTQYDITYKSLDPLKINAVNYDSRVKSMVFSITSHDEYGDLMELQMSPQTFSELLTMGPNCLPKETFLLANGMELEYKVYEGDSIMWRFTVPPNTSEIELIGSNNVGQGIGPIISGIEKTYKINADSQIVLAGHFLNSCGAPIKNGTISLSTTGLPMPRMEQTISDYEGYFEFKILSHNLEGINIVKGVLYGETDHVKTSLYDIDFLIPISSLKQQIENSILSKNLMCRENLILIFKYDDSPACVKEEKHYYVNG